MQTTSNTTNPGNGSKITLTNEQAYLIQNAYLSFKYQDLLDYKNQGKWAGDTNEFEMHCYKAIEVMDAITEITQSWDSNAKSKNFLFLHQIFITFISVNPDKSTETFELYSLFTNLIAKVLQREDTIYKMDAMYNMYLEAFKNQANIDLVFKNSN